MSADGKEKRKISSSQVAVSRVPDMQPQDCRSEKRLVDVSATIHSEREQNSQ
jgi:hypothetical protein